MKQKQQEVIRDINTRFDCLKRDQSWKSFELDNLRRELTERFLENEKQILRDLKKICSPYVPEDDKAFRQKIIEKGFSCGNIETEEQLSTILLYMLTPSLPLSQENMTYCQSLPESTYSVIESVIGADNLCCITTQTKELFEKRDSFITALLNEIPPLMVDIFKVQNFDFI